MFNKIREAIAKRRYRKRFGSERENLLKNLDDQIVRIEKSILASEEKPFADRLRKVSEGTKAIREYRESVAQELLLGRLERAGIEIPERFLSPTELCILPSEIFERRKVLNDAGKHWARVQLRRYNEQRIEFWAKLIFPILSLIMSIIALVVSIHKH